MKKLLLIVFLLLALAGGALYFIMPSNYDWDGYVKEITAQVRKQTGLSLRIQGTPQFSMTPSPMIKVGRITLGNVRDGTFPQILEAQSAEFLFDKGLAFKRQIHIKKIVLKNPKLSLERLPDGKWNWQAAFFDRRSANAAMGFDGVLMTDATVEVKHDKYTPVEIWKNMNAELLADSAAGPFFFEGNVAAMGTTFGFSFKSDKFGKNESPNVALRVINAPAEATFTFSGKYGLTDGDKGDISGNITFDIRKTEVLFSLFSNQKLPAVLFQPAVGSAKIKSSASARQNILSDFLFKYGQSSATGSVKIKTLSPEEASAVQAQKEEEEDEFDLVLRDPNNPNETVSLSDAPASQTKVAEFLLPKEYEASFIFTKFAGDVFFDNMKNIANALAASGTFSDRGRQDKVSVDLTFDAAEYKNNMIRRMKVKAQTTEDGLDFPVFGASLPGDIDVSGSGRLILKKSPVLDAAVKIDGENIGTTLRWLGVETQGDLSSAALRNFRASANLKAVEGGLTLKNIDALLDRSSVRGAVGLRFGARPAVQIAAAVSEWDASLYFPRTSNAFADSFENLKSKGADEKIKALTESLTVFNDADVAVGLSAESMSFGGIDARKVKIGFTAQNGAMSVKEFSADNVLDADVRAAGTIKRFGSDPVFENFSVEAETKKFSVFAKNAGITGLPAELERQDNVRVSTVMNGTLDSMNFKAEMRTDTLSVSANGQIKRKENGFAADFSAEAKADNFRKFVLLFTNKYRPMNANPGAMTLTANVSVEPLSTKLTAAHLTVGRNVLDGTLEWDKSGEIPQFSMTVGTPKLYYAEIMPSVNVLTDFNAAETDENKPFFSPGMLAGMEQISFPKTKFDFGFMGHYKLIIALNADKVLLPGLVLSDVDASFGTTKDGNSFYMNIDKSKIDGAQAVLSAGGTVTGNTADVHIQFSLLNVNIDSVLFGDDDGPDLKQIKQGTLTLTGQGVGASMFDFAQSFDGKGSVTFDQATLTGMSYDALDPQLASLVPERKNYVRGAVFSGETVLRQGDLPYTVKNGEFLFEGIKAQYGDEQKEAGTLTYKPFAGEFRAAMSFVLKTPNVPEFWLYVTKRAGQMLVVGDNLDDLILLGVMRHDERQQAVEQQREQTRQVLEKQAQEELKRRQDLMFALEKEFSPVVQDLSKKVAELSQYKDVYQVERYFASVEKTYNSANELLEKISKGARSSDSTSNDLLEWRRQVAQNFVNRQSAVEKDFLMAMSLGVKGRIFDFFRQANTVLSDLAAKKMTHADVPAVAAAVSAVMQDVAKLKALEQQAEKEQNFEKQTVLLSEAGTVFQRVVAENGKAEAAIADVAKRKKEAQEAAKAAQEARQKAEAEAKAAQEARQKAEAEAKAAEEKKRQATIHRRGGTTSDAKEGAAAVLQPQEPALVPAKAETAGAPKTGGIIRRR